MEDRAVSGGEGVLVFDLDDTLYLERDFAFSGFRAAGDWYAGRSGLHGLAQRCEALFNEGRRTKIFDEALCGLGVAVDEALVGELVAVYRGHTPAIALAPDAERFFRGRRPGKRLAMITDGPSATQLAKVQALGLDRLVEHIIYTDAWGAEFWKPHPRAFAAIEAWSESPPSRIAYVADNPRKDFVTPRARGWWTVQVARADRVHRGEAPEEAYKPHIVLPDLDALEAGLAGLQSG
nr:HAD family hydrolase [Sinorhizobium mexicanum]